MQINPSDPTCINYPRYGLTKRVRVATLAIHGHTSNLHSKYLQVEISFDVVEANYFARNSIVDHVE